jgi:hypothetical protein
MCGLFRSSLSINTIGVLSMRNIVVITINNTGEYYDRLDLCYPVQGEYLEFERAPQRYYC